jgi:uncharacterized protein (DUF58 family)
MTLANPIRWFLDSRIATPDRHGRVRLAYRQVFILPTRLGWGFALLLLLMLVGAINYNNSLAYALSFLLAGLGQVALYHTYRNLIGLELQAGATRDGFAGGSAAFELRLHNPSARTRPALSAGLERASRQTTGIPANHSVSLWLARPAHRRGRLPSGTLLLETRYPLGLFRTWTRLRLAQTAWVYPRPAPAPPPPQAPRLPSEAGDQGRGSDDFRGFRPFHSGDSLRHVHWKAVARGQGMLTKEFGGDRVEECWFDWEALPGMDPEARLSVLCRWVLDAAERRQHFGLRLPGCRLGPDQGPAHRERCLRALADLGNAP